MIIQIPPGRDAMLLRSSSRRGRRTAPPPSAEAVDFDVSAPVEHVESFLDSALASPAFRLVDEAERFPRWIAENDPVGGAEFNLGFLYQHGEGVDKDPKKAAEWYQQAAERGHPSAQYNLGGMYLRGDGVEKDLVMAYFWRKLAADDEDEQSAGLAAIAKKMTSSELSKAKKAVKNWKPRR